MPRRSQPKTLLTPLRPGALRETLAGPSRTPRGGPVGRFVLATESEQTNAVAQAEIFAGAIDVSGIFLAKLDGTAKGGIVLAIKERLGIPVKLIGVGETPEDVEPFDPDAFVAAMFEED